MYKTSFRVSLLVIILVLPWTIVQAAGLGKLTLNSALGQPLTAEIDIVTSSSDDVSSLKASIATREAYAQAGINYESILSTVKASIESRTNGNPYIKLTSPQAINDPFLMILMELNWSSGRILREYTVLLDPVETNTQNLAANTGPVSAMIATRLDEEKAPSAEKNNRATKSSKSRNNPPDQAKKSYGPVRRGDTLSAIARQVSPAGVDLNQMLVALYRANRDAFIADNMNLLKTGTVLKIPEKNEITEIDASTAKAEIKMQVADWHSYQGKLAEITRESSAPHAISQSDQGQITTTLSKKSGSAPGSSKEILRLSSGAQLLDKDGKIPDSAVVERLRMMEEDAIARNLALKEANERVAILEKSIENLKQLLELKDSVLAQAQLKAELAPKAVAKPEAQSTIALDSTPEKDIQLNSVPAQAVAARPAAETIVQSAPANPLPLPSDTESQSWIDLLFNYIEYIGAALVLGLSLILLIMRRRRNQLDEEVEDEDERKENFSSAMRSRMTTMAAAEAATDAAAELPASENTETYQNINSYSEDEEFDKDAKYYEDNVAKYDSVAESQIDNEQELDVSQQEKHLIDEDEPDSFEERYDQSIDSDNNLTDSANQIDFDLNDEVDEIKQNISMNQLSSDDEMGLSSAKQDLRESENETDNALEINFDDSERSLDSINLDDNTIENEKIDFDLSDSDIELAEDKIAASDDESITADSSENTPALTGESLEFDQSLNIANEISEGEPETKIPELELANINLDLEDSDQGKEPGDTADSSEKSEQWQEVETKLDLAKAYQEMDDKEGAKEMLEEVIRDGDEKQKKLAKKMLKSL